MKATVITVRAYHGGELEGASWYTTDRGHAALFGDVHEVELESSIEPVRLDASELDGADVGGYRADAILWAHLESLDATWAVVTGWEGPGECVIVREAWRVRVRAL